MNIITHTEDLKQFCNQIITQTYIAIDTEFIREGKYWSELCLIQIASQDQYALIDPLSPEINLEPLYDCLHKETLLKVFHAPRQDLEIFYQQTKQLPKPVFDTQIAAMALGLGENLSYEALVKTRLNKQINKASRFTNWKQRPLTKEQIKYAISDVTHLSALFPEFYNELKDKNRLDWIDQETSSLLNEEIYKMEPHRAWKQLKIKSYSKSYLANLMALAKWRETQAQRNNIPRAKIMTDDLIYKIAQLNPKHIQEIKKIRSISASFLNRATNTQLIDLLNTAQTDFHLEISNIKKPKPVSNKIKVIKDMLKLLLSIKSEQYRVNARLIASSKEIEHLVLIEPTEIKSPQKSNIQALKGWRYEVFGKDALELKTGKLTLGLKGSEIQLIKTD